MSIQRHFSKLYTFQHSSFTTVMTCTQSQNIIIPLFLLIEAFGPSYPTAAEFLLAWTIAPVFRVNDILLSIFSGHKILSTELETHNPGRVMKNMAYVSEQISENNVIENEMWPDWCWKPYFYVVVSYRGNVCSLKKNTKFRKLSSGKHPHLLAWIYMTHYKS